MVLYVWLMDLSLKLDREDQPKTTLKGPISFELSEDYKECNNFFDNVFWGEWNVFIWHVGVVRWP